jgi:hypothetical protein
VTMTQEPQPNTIEAPEQSGASSYSDSALVALIQDLTAQVAELKRDVQTTKAMTPAYKPMDRADPSNAALRRAQIEALGHQQKSGADFTEGTKDGAWIPVTSGIGIAGVEGNRIPENMLGSLGRRFKDGDLVRINPDVTREGATKPWGEILDRLGSDGVGVVTQVLDFRKCGMWKYKVRVPKLGNHGGMDGYYDRELLPA